MAFEPVVLQKPEAKKVFLAFARSLVAASGQHDQPDRQRAIEKTRRSTIGRRGDWARSWRAPLIAAIELLADLVRLGWKVEVKRGKVSATRPPSPSPAEQRNQFRQQLQSAREQQLRERSVQDFVRELERPRVVTTGKSIFSLMRDGRELAKIVESSSKDRNAAAALCDAIKPYIVAVDESSVCPYTGIRLNDIWRYFRHTWANPYQSVPGRSMNFLVRDAAAPNHPVIGLAALSSAAAQLTSRDRFIGWEAESFIEHATQSPSAEIGEWALRSVDRFIDEVYASDFVARGVITARNLANPNESTCSALDAEADIQRAHHHELMRSGEYKKTIPLGGGDDDFWQEEAQRPLFVGKRAGELSSLFRIRRVLISQLGTQPTAESLLALLKTPLGRAALGRVARKAKAKRVGVCIADLSVCGAVPPYNDLLGGKLVAMLATSPRVIAEYRRRYEGTPSVIASSMAGRRICRDPELVLIGTTSLYGIRPSQYDRLSMPSDRLGGSTGESIRYHFLEHTQGMGTFQFSDATVSAFKGVLRQSRNGLTVNSVFGEGANPRMRVVRDALDKLGLPSSVLIRHAQPRLVYVVPLVRNLRRYLLGFDSHADYLFDRTGSDEAVATWWIERWLAPRITERELVTRLKRHNLTLPIRHGARVVLPEADLDEVNLF